MTDVIHVAYSVSRKFGTSYRARAFVSRDGFKHTHSVAIGDTREEAEAQAVAYIRETYQREGLAFPTEIVRHGKLAGLVLDHFHFG